MISRFKVAIAMIVTPKENASAACLLRHFGKYGYPVYFVLYINPINSGLI